MAQRETFVPIAFEKSIMKNATLFLSLSFVAAGHLLGAVFVVPSDRDMVSRSEAVVLGSALSSYSRLTAEGGVETVTAVSVERVIKGTVLSTVIDVVEPGGEYEGRFTAISGVPRFANGERMLLFLTRTGPARWAVTDLVLGKFRFASDVAGEQLLVRDDEEITGWDPDSTPHREARRSAAKFLDFVSAVAHGGSPAATYETNVRKLRPQSALAIAPNAAPYSANSYTIFISGSSGARWNVFPSPVTFFRSVNAEPGAPGGGDTAINIAFASWNNDCGSIVNYLYGGVDNGTHTQGLHGADGANTILFDRDLTSYGILPFTCTSNGYSGTVGLGGITSAGGSHLLNGETFITTLEADVEMNQGVANCTRLFSLGEFNSAVTHEFGHTLGFRHSDQNRSSTAPCSTDPSLECSSGAIMTAAVTPNLNGALAAWDVNAVRAVYPGGSCSTAAARVRGDFNGDGRSDIVWRNASASISTIWFMNNLTVQPGSGVTSLQISGAYQVAAVADLSGDGIADIIWRNPNTGDNILWVMSGTNVVAGSGGLPPVGGAWRIAGAADFNADGHADVVWRNPVTGENSIWLMSGTTILTGSGALPTIQTPWDIAGIGDFSGDGRADLLWRNSATGATSVWFMNGASLSTSVPTNIQISPLYQVAAIGDFTGDAIADIIWRHSSSGDNIMWIMSGANVVGGGAMLQIADTNWKIEAVGDYNADSRYDLVWRNDSTGVTSMWLLNGTTILGGSGTLATVPSSYIVAGPGPKYW
jgi:hypothetical protein